MLTFALVVFFVVVGVLRFGFRRCGLSLLGACFAAAPMNAVRLRDLPISDIFLGLSFFILWTGNVVEHRSQRRSFRWPNGLFGASALFVFVGLLNEVAPTSHSYLASRYFGFAELADPGSSNLLQLSKFLVAVLLLPLVTLYASLSGPEGMRLIRSWLLGTAISALVGVSDLLGLTSIGIVTNAGQNESGRVAGLTIHPNHLAASIAMAVPMVFVFSEPKRRYRRVPWVLLALLAGGAFASGSRTGQAGVLLSFVGALATQPSLRRMRRLTIPFFGALAAAFSVWPNSLYRFLESTRFAGGVAGESNSERAVLRAQGVEDFLHRPILGIGYGHLNEAHEVHIQIAAATGLIGILAALLYFYFAFRATTRALQIDRIVASGILLSLGCWMVLAFTSNLVADRYLYVPVALGYAFSRISNEARQRTTTAENRSSTLTTSLTAPPS